MPGQGFSFLDDAGTMTEVTGFPPFCDRRQYLKKGGGR